MKEREITIKKKITDDDLVNILCGATSTACSGWATELDWDDDCYSEAREMLIGSGRKVNNICMEDVLLQLLKMGNDLRFWDDEDEEWHELDMEKLINGIESYMNSEYCESVDIDDWDDTDFDAVIQYALFDELVYG